MKKKNGFTLVELLAVIVVLAIIMIIAIPSVLDVMNRARKSSFVLYAEKVINAVQTQYTYDAGLADIAGAGYYVYDIKSDLGLTSTGAYEGYVVVDANSVDNPEYILFLYDNNYQVLTHYVSSQKMPTVGDVYDYDAPSAASTAGSAALACKAAGATVTGDGANCYTRQGYVVIEGSGA